MIKWTFIWFCNTANKETFSPIWSIITLILVCQFNLFKNSHNKLPKEYPIFISKILYMGILNPVIFSSIKNYKSKYVTLDCRLKEKINKKLMEQKVLLTTLLQNVSFHMTKKLIFGHLVSLYSSLQQVHFLSKLLLISNWLKSWLKKNSKSLFILKKCL